MVSFLFTPGRKLGGFPLSATFHAGFLECSDASASARSSPPIAQSLPVLSEAGLLCAQDTSWALAYMSSELLKLDQGLQSQGITG